MIIFFCKKKSRFLNLGWIIPWFHQTSKVDCNRIFWQNFHILHAVTVSSIPAQTLGWQYLFAKESSIAIMTSARVCSIYEKHPNTAFGNVFGFLRNIAKCMSKDCLVCEPKRHDNPNGSGQNYLLAGRQEYMSSDIKQYHTKNDNQKYSRLRHESLFTWGLREMFNMLWEQ